MNVSESIDRYAGSLAGQTALVTGAGTGIGRACAIAFGRAGADVALLGRRAPLLRATEEAIVALGRKVVVLPCDVRDPGAVDEAVSRVAEDLGPVTIAVANAGTNAWADLEDLAPETLRDALATNVEGVANLARAVVPGMRERGTGRLIVVASDNGRRAEAGGSGYVASKFGAVGMALSLSQELSDAGVSVHVIEPGCVDTEWYPPEEEAPRERMLQADDVALVALFLTTLPAHVVLDEVMMLPRGLLVDPW
ncbi:MAG TPA: SDR family oxidoreductase [Actinomycetota bacterium]|nr:SDR family oxidoreductase [Actinomycetota bacterium]